MNPTYLCIMKTSVVYTITNLVNNKIYVGYTDDYNTRKYNHLNELIDNRHKNNHLQRAFNKYGENNFIIEILEEYSENLLIAMEHYWATILNVHNKKYGYNIAPTNPNSRSSKPMLGRKHSMETKIKISKNRLGKGIGKDNGFYGKKHSEETKKEMSQKRMGHKITEETRLKQSQSKKGRIPKNIKLLIEKRKNFRETREQILKRSEKRKKRVYQFDMNNMLIAEYRCAQEVIDILGFKTKSEITRCCNNGRMSKTAYGFKWSYNL